MKRIYAILTSAAMLLSFSGGLLPEGFAAPVFAEETQPLQSGDFQYEKYITSSQIQITKYTGSDAVVEIPAEIDGKSVVKIGPEAFAGNTNLTAVSLPDSIKDIAKSAFEGCTKLTGITIPDKVTDVGEKAFAGCTALKEVHFSQKLSLIYSRVFQGCTALESIEIPVNIKRIYSEAFGDCTSLKSISFPEKMDNIDNTSFKNTPWLKAEQEKGPLVIVGNLVIDGKNATGDITIPEGIEHICSNSFAYNFNVTSVTLPEGIISIESWAFYQCPALKAINFPEGLEKIGMGGVTHCKELDHVVLPESLTELGVNAFNDCESLSDVSIPETLNKIGGSVFQDTPWLKAQQEIDPFVVVNHWLIDATTAAGEVTVPDTVTNITSYAFEDNAAVTAVTIPESVQSFDYYVFENCTALEKVVIPRSVTKFGYADFENCEKVTVYGYAGSEAEKFAKSNNVPFVALDGEAPETTTTPVTTTTVPVTTTTVSETTTEAIGTTTAPEQPELKSVVFDEETGTLTLRGNVSRDELKSIYKYKSKKLIAEDGTVLPEDCSYLLLGDSIESIDLSKADTSYVKNMASMFWSCSNLTEINVSGWNTSNVTDMSSLFDGCSKLTELDLSGWDTSNVTNMSQMFNDCESLTELDLSGFDVSNVSNMAWMFLDCMELKTIYVSEFDTANAENMEQMFSFCEKLVGGNGTAYNRNNKDYTSGVYARIDTADTPGYFTAKDAPVNPHEPVTTTTETTTETTTTETTTVTTTTETATETTTTAPEQPELKSVVFDEETGTLTLRGNVVADEVKAYSENEAVKKVVCEEGAVLPENCGGLFYQFRAESIDLSKADASNAANANRMFFNCNNLKELNLAGFDTSKVTNMSEMFDGCSKLTELDLSGFDTSNVTAMNWMFHGCNRLETLNLSGFDTSKVSTMANMFLNCEKLTVLDLSDFTIPDLRNTESMFGNDIALKSIFVSDHWNLSTDANKVTMFYNCPALVGGNGTAYDADHINGEYARIDTADAPGYFTAKDAPEQPTYDNIKFDKKTGTLTLSGKVDGVMIAMVLSAPDTKVLHVVAEAGTTFADGCGSMFSGEGLFSELKSVDFSAGNITTQESCASMFVNCKNLTSVDLSGFDTSQVTTMSHMFDGCEALTETNFSGLDTSNVTNMTYMFSGCEALTELDLSAFNTTNVTNMNWMFWGDPELKTIRVSDGWTMENVKKSDEMFTFDTALTGGSGTAFDDAHVDGEYARIDTADAPGYFTAKDAPEQPTYDNIKFDKKTGTLTLSGKVDGVMIAMVLSAPDTKVLHVVAEAGTTFADGCGSMFSGEGLFSELKSVDFSAGNITTQESCASMFVNCKNLTSVDLSGFDTSQVTTIFVVFDVSAFEKSAVSTSANRLPSASVLSNNHEAFSGKTVPSAATIWRTGFVTFRTNAVSSLPEISPLSVRVAVSSS